MAKRAVRLIEPECVRCQRCGLVTIDPCLALARPDLAAPCCGATGRRDDWPPFSTALSLEIVEEQDRGSTGGLRVAVVFLAVAYEAVFSGILRQLVEAHTSSKAATDALMADHWGLSRQRKLFNKLSDTPLGDLLGAGGPHGEPALWTFGAKWGPERAAVKTSGNHQFLKDWDRLVELRNQLAHGETVNVTQADEDVLQRVEARGLTVLAGLHNDVIRQRQQRGLSLP